MSEIVIMRENNNDSDLISWLLKETYNGVDQSEGPLLSSNDLDHYFSQKGTSFGLNAKKECFSRETLLTKSILHFSLDFNIQTSMFSVEIDSKRYDFPSNWSYFASLNELRVKSRNDFLWINSLGDSESMADVFSLLMGFSCSIGLLWEENRAWIIFFDMKKNQEIFKILQENQKIKETSSNLSSF